MSKPMITYGVSEVASWLGVSRAAITNYLERHDAPEPDAVVLTAEVEFKGWKPERRAEWEAFYRRLHPSGARKRSSGRYRPEGP